MWPLSLERLALLDDSSIRSCGDFGKLLNCSVRPPNGDGVGLLCLSKANLYSRWLLAETTVGRKQISNHFAFSDGGDHASTDCFCFTATLQKFEVNALSLRHSVQEQTDRTSTDRADQQILSAIIVEIGSDDRPLIGIQVGSGRERGINEIIAGNIQENAILLVGTQVFPQSRQVKRILNPQFSCIDIQLAQHFMRQ